MLRVANAMNIPNPETTPVPANAPAIRGAAELQGGAAELQGADGDAHGSPTRPSLLDFILGRLLDTLEAETGRWTNFWPLLISSLLLTCLIVWALHVRRKMKKQKGEDGEVDSVEQGSRPLCWKHDPANGHRCPNIPPHGNCPFEHLDTTVAGNAEKFEDARRAAQVAKENRNRRREIQTRLAKADRFAALRGNAQVDAFTEGVADDVGQLWGSLSQTERRQLVKERGSDKGRLDSTLQSAIQEAGMLRLKEALAAQRMSSPGTT